MADITIAGIGLDITGAYQAAYVTIPLEDLPSNCTLPDFTPPPDLPSPVVLPATVCKTTFPPLIPIPEVCIPTVGADITITPCDAGYTNSAQVDSTIEMVETGCCGFSLQGGIKVCVPCIPQFTGTVQINSICSGVNVEQPITLVPTVTDDFGHHCTYELQGIIDFAIPSVTVALTIEENPVCDLSRPDVENVIKVSTATPIQIVPVYTGDYICEYHLEGDIKLCAAVKCPLGYTVHNTMTVTDTGTGEVTDTPLSLDFNTGCLLELSGNINTFCNAGISFTSVTFPVIISTPGGSPGPTVDMSVIITQDGDSCGYTISGNLNYTLPGTAKTINICDGGSPSTITVYQLS